MTDDLCVVCRRREPASGYVCQPDRARIAEQLGDLPRKIAALSVQLMPGPAGAGERVSVSRTGSPTPARLDVLSLIGPGASDITAAFHPLVRRWRTSRTVTVSVIKALGELEVEDREVIEWHREIALDDEGRPVYVLDDDQAGAVPPAEWLAGWARAWRAHFGHHTPAPKPSPGHLRGGSDIATRLGLGPARKPADRPMDPLADEMNSRFGVAFTTAAATNVKYLLTWLDHACDADADVAAMASELRALAAELTRVLGERPDQQWLGRCPAVLSQDTGTDEVCGASLWQDPHASQVQCPRCHTTWGPRGVELLYLASEIRRVWPVDRRRRYNADEIDGLAPPACRACRATMKITWREVTATTDDRRWWRPDAMACPGGCPDPGRSL